MLRGYLFRMLQGVDNNFECKYNQIYMFFKNLQKSGRVEIICITDYKTLMSLLTVVARGLEMTGLFIGRTNKSQ